MFGGFLVHFSSACILSISACYSSHDLYVHLINAYEIPFKILVTFKRALLLKYMNCGCPLCNHVISMLLCRYLHGKFI